MPYKETNTMFLKFLFLLFIHTYFNCERNVFSFHDTYINYRYIHIM